MRKEYLDIAKGLGILLVVFGHALEVQLGDGTGGPFGAAHRPSIFTAWKLIYSFHMPLFFVLAGMATTRLAGVKLEKVLSGALYLIVVATILQLVFAPLRLALPLPIDAIPSSLPDAIRAVLWPAVKLEGYALAVIWFLPCLALVRMVAWRVGNATRPTAAAFIVALGILCLAEEHFGVGYLQMRSVIVGLAFFAIGQRLGDLPIDRLPRAARWSGLAGALLLTALTFDANRGCAFSLAQTCPGPRYGQFAVLMVSGAFGFLPLFALTSLAGAVAILAASLLLSAASWAHWLALIGRHTLEVLVVNGIVLVFVQPALSHHVTDLWSPLVIAPLVLAQLALAFALHPVLGRFLWFAKETAARLACVRPFAGAAISRTPR